MHWNVSWWSCCVLQFYTIVPPLAWPPPAACRCRSAGWCSPRARRWTPAARTGCGLCHRHRKQYYHLQGRSPLTTGVMDQPKFLELLLDHSALSWLDWGKVEFALPSKMKCIEEFADLFWSNCFVLKVKILCVFLVWETVKILSVDFEHMHQLLGLVKVHQVFQTLQIIRQYSTALLKNL